LDFTKSCQDFDFTEVKEPPILSINRGFSAPVKLVIKRSDEELSFLIANDVDLFNRWDAAQELFIRLILSRVGSVDLKEYTLSVNQITEAFRAVLKDKTIDRRFVAALLTLPSETYLADQMKVIDIDGISIAREQLIKELSSSLKDELLEVYNENLVSGTYKYQLSDVSKRALKNRVMSYLSSLDSDKMIQLSRSGYKEANNMTDVLASLICLSNIDYPNRENDLNMFQQRWIDDPLVMDLWFGIHGRSRFSNVESIKKLMEHPKFNNKNPNRIRALIGSFCSGNLVNFHNINGDGYIFLADQILRLDSFNPLEAARLMGPFSRWRKLDSRRKKMVKEQLQRILKQENLSPNTFEVASKTLAD
ncbi:MAG: DUF3458 domain-containing protein, partial [Proteobacteria bacterium]|nr:DUF3458 domain-containing protein [Pseudomonadota bacterium]